MTPGDIHIVSGPQALWLEAARIFVKIGQRAIAKDALFRVALSGGKTPTGLYETLASAAFSEQLNWNLVHCFFGDERGVPPDHPDSNFRMADTKLFQPLALPSEHIYRMKGEMTSPDAAANDYEQQIMNHFQVSYPTIPEFHLILLGMGEDGHTASLFPGSPAIQEMDRYVVPTQAPQGITQRLTLTIPLINHAEAILVMISGATKAAMVNQVLSPNESMAHEAPISMIRPTHGRLIWLLDQDSAKALC